MKCDKCLTEYEIGVKYTDLNKVYNLCFQCNAVFALDNIQEFLKEDCGQFFVGEIDKRMINARRNRALGKGAWNELNGDNKGELLNAKEGVERLSEMAPKGEAIV